MQHKGKKLLILGATSYISHVVNIAHSMGVITIVADPSAESPAKKISDKSYNVDTTDFDSLLFIAKEEKVDGVMTAYSDVNLPICRRLCDQLHLPFYASMHNIEQTVDKVKFKQMCRKYNVPVVPEYSEQSIDDIKFPVIVKPSDSYGSKGITVCQTRTELINGINNAKSHSPTHKVIIEKYLTCNDVNLDYVMQDGNIILSAVGDRFVNKDQIGLSPLSLVVLYPSKYTDRYIQEVNDNVKKMLSAEGFDNGTAFIQSFMDDESFYFFEMGYRPGGGQSSIILSSINGIDYIEYLINFALSGRMSDINIESINRVQYDKVACGLVVLLKQGIIGSIEGFDILKNIPEVLNITQFFKVGDVVAQSAIGNLGQSFARIHIVAANKKRLGEVIDIIQTHLVIKNDKQEDMRLSGLDTSIIS